MTSERRMYDSTTISDIPDHATMVAAYIDGRYANVLEARRRFPDATHVSITVTGRLGAHVVDCETGDLTPAHAADWARREIGIGAHPTIYTYSSQWPAVKAAVRAAGLRAEQVSYWIADYDGDPTIPTGAVAKQYADPHITGHHYDLSSVAAVWPGVDTKPGPIPSPDSNRVKAQRLLRRVLRLLAKGKKK